MTDLSGKLPNHNLETLKKAGIKTAEQIVLLSDNALLKLGNLCPTDVKEIKKIASNLLLPGGFSNAFVWGEFQASLGKISTGCNILDKYLRGGLRPRTLVEIFGESGCGKTQIALQISTNCWKNGAVYICTEDVFPSKRLQQMFKSWDSKQKEHQELSVYGQNIFVLHVTELEDLKQCLHTQLPRLLSKVKTISLVVLDSIAAPFRGEFQNDMKARAQHLKEIGAALLQHAKKYNLVALCINQVSANMNSIGDEIIPCLGLTWSNMLTTRIRLRKTDKYCHKHDVIQKSKEVTKNVFVEPHQHTTAISIAESNMLQIREFKIMTSPELPSQDSVEYVITLDGVVGLEK